MSAHDDISSGPDDRVYLFMGEIPERLDRSRIYDGTVASHDAPAYAGDLPCTCEGESQRGHCFWKTEACR